MSGLTIAISAGLAAAGAGTEAYANNQAAKQQDQIAAQGILKQAALKQQANADVSKNIQTASKNQTNVDTNQSALQEQYDAALNRGAPVQATQGAMPGGSKRFAADTTAALANNANYGRTIAGTAAAVGAPQLTNMETQAGLGSTATSLAGLNDTSNQQNALTQMQVNAVTANPWLLATGAALQGASKGYGAKAGFASAAPATGGAGSTLDASAMSSLLHG